jgi:hypothetical protein
MTKNKLPSKSRANHGKKRRFSKLAFFSLFQISNTNIFVIFGFFHPKLFLYFLKNVRELKDATCFSRTYLVPGISPFLEIPV